MFYLIAQDAPRGECHVAGPFIQEQTDAEGFWQDFGDCGGKFESYDAAQASCDELETLYDQARTA